MSQYTRYEQHISGGFRQAYLTLLQQSSKLGPLEYEVAPGLMINSDQTLIEISNAYEQREAYERAALEKELDFIKGVATPEFGYNPNNKGLSEEEKDRRLEIAQELKERGHNVIKAECWERWDAYVDKAVNISINGEVAKNAYISLEMMEAVENGASVKDLSFFVGRHMSDEMTIEILSRTMEDFSVHGQGMYAFVQEGDMSGLDSFVNPPMEQDRSVNSIFCQMVEAQRQGADFGELARILWTSYSSDRMTIARLFDKETDFKYNMSFHADQIMTGDKQVIFNTAIEHNGKDYILATGIVGIDLDTCHRELQNMEKEYDRPICYLFNDSVIYSDMTIDEVYQSITGETKGEYEQHLSEMHKSHQQDEDIEQEEIEEEIAPEIGE